MKLYIVPLDVLFLIKEIINMHARHASHCAIDMTEFCTCGLSDKLRRYRSECNRMKEITPELARGGQDGAS